MTTAYGRAALDGEVADLQTAQTGERNERLNRAAFNLGRHVGGASLDGQSVEEDLLTAALDMGLEPREARSVIRSGLNAGKKRPRIAPEQVRPHARLAKPPRPDYRLRSLLVKLADDPAWPLEWETAKLLATLPPVLAQQDIVANWDYLAARMSIPRMWATVTLLRGVVMFRYLAGKTVERPEPTEDEPHPRHPIDIAARRLVLEVESR